MFRNAALVQVICPGSEVPGPPRGGPKNCLALAAGGGDGLTDATSNDTVSGVCANAVHPRINMRVVKGI